jgi:Cys-rich repeat protein
MTFLRSTSPSIRLGVSTALTLLWIACGGNAAVDSGHGGGGTGGDACCTTCSADCIPGDCATGAFCDTCTVCQLGVMCTTDTDCPSGATCDKGFTAGLCTTGVSCRSNADCPAGSGCDGSTCFLTHP